MPTGELYARWKSARQVGAAKPSLRVTVTRGLIDKHYDDFALLDGSHPRPFRIVEGNNRKPWQGFWRPTGEPIELPNVLAVKWSKDFSQKGTASATIEVENIIYKAIVGIGGTYHAIMRGYLSPWLGAQIITRATIPSWIENEWFEVLDNGYKIDVFEGYGDQQKRTFCGLIEEADFETVPDRITITARTFGVLATDQRVMGWNKPPEIKAPLQIADRERTLGIKPEGFAASASSTASGRPVGGIVRSANRTAWVSAGHAGAEANEWVEIGIPPGYYEGIYLALPYKGQALHISINAGAGSAFNGVPVAGWVDGGKGNVPGTAIPFTNAWGSSSASGVRRPLNGALEAKGKTRIRVWLSNLPYRSEWGDHRAGVTRLAGMLTGTNAHPLNGTTAKHAKHWVLIDDLADIAKAVFMWMGFHEWQVEDLGFSLTHPMAWAMDKFFIDMLTDIAAQADWLFFLKSPSPNEESLGVPCFVHNTATDGPPRNMLEVRDDDLLESVKAKIDLSNLPYIIRYRGNVDPNGTPYESDAVKRFAGTYFPPWSGAGPVIVESGRTSGVRRHELTIDSNLFSDEECIFAAILAAIQYALSAYTAELQISGYPEIELNDQISVVDKTTAINSRMWVASIHSEHTTGPSGSWKMTVGGSLLDGIDMQQLRSDLEEWKAIVKTLKQAKEQVVGGLIA
jgi:hypothetical protein